MLKIKLMRAQLMRAQLISSRLACQACLPSLLPKLVCQACLCSTNIRPVVSSDNNSGGVSTSDTTPLNEVRPKAEGEIL